MTGPARCWDDEPGCNCANASPVVPPGGEDALREALADTIVDAWRTWNGDEKVLELARRFADALLPVVLADRERHARQRAAEELRAIGRAGLAATPGAHPVRVPVGYLYDRADALTREAPVGPADPLASLQDFLR